MLGEHLKEVPSIRLLSWASSYDMRADGVTLTEGACKQYLEELLTAVRRSLERMRTMSTSSSSSVKTPVKDARDVPNEDEKIENYEDDMMSSKMLFSF